MKSCWQSLSQSRTRGKHRGTESQPKRWLFCLPRVHQGRIPQSKLKTVLHHLLYKFSHAPYTRTKSRPHESRGRVGQRTRTMFFARALEPHADASQQRQRNAGRAAGNTQSICKPPSRSTLKARHKPGGFTFFLCTGIFAEPPPEKGRLETTKTDKRTVNQSLQDMQGLAIICNKFCQVNKTRILYRSKSVFLCKN